MALSHVTINHANIRGFFENAPLGGTTRGSTRGLGRGQAESIAEAMAVQARSNAGRFEQRTGRLKASVRPIVRHLPSGTEVGVGTTVEHGKWLEIGTDFHFIRAKNARFLQSNPADPIRGPVPDKWELEGKHKILPHPGNAAYHWMSNAVRSIIPNARVIVRTFG